MPLSTILYEEKDLKFTNEKAQPNGVASLDAQGKIPAEQLPAQFTQPYTNANSVVVDHNLGKYPTITILDSTGKTFEGNDIVHNSPNQCTVSWIPLMSGTIICD